MAAINGDYKAVFKVGYRSEVARIYIQNTQSSGCFNQFLEQVCKHFNNFDTQIAQLEWTDEDCVRIVRDDKDLRKVMRAFHPRVPCMRLVAKAQEQIKAEEKKANAIAEQCKAEEIAEDKAKAKEGEQPRETDKKQKQANERRTAQREACERVIAIKSGKISHYFSCDICKEMIVGSRFSCASCPGTFCAKCEQSGVHGYHPLIRLRVPVTHQLATKLHDKSSAIRNAAKELQRSRSQQPVVVKAKDWVNSGSPRRQLIHVRQRVASLQYHASVMQQMFMKADKEAELLSVERDALAQQEAERIEEQRKMAAELKKLAKEASGKNEKEQNRKDAEDNAETNHATSSYRGKFDSRKQRLRDLLIHCSHLYDAAAEQRYDQEQAKVNWRKTVEIFRNEIAEKKREAAEAMDARKKAVSWNKNIATVCDINADVAVQENVEGIDKALEVLAIPAKDSSTVTALPADTVSSKVETPETQVEVKAEEVAEENNATEIETCNDVEEQPDEDGFYIVTTREADSVSLCSWDSQASSRADSPVDTAAKHPETSQEEEDKEEQKEDEEDVTASASRFAVEEVAADQLLSAVHEEQEEQAVNDKGNAIIADSNIQQGGAEKSPNAASEGPASYEATMEKLKLMGFDERQLVMALLDKHRGNINIVLNQIL